MKNSLALLFLFASIILLIPTAAARTPAGSITLTSGTTSLIGSVNVSNLPATSQYTTNTNQAPLHSQGAQAFDQGKAQVGQSGYIPTGESTNIVATAPSVPTPQTVTVGLILEGAPGGAPNPCGCSPPDVIAGAGPNHVFEMVNLAGIIYTKTGTVAKATFGLDTFFGLPASSESDPQVSFDASSGRWFASIIDIPGSRVVFAVSTTNDPTGTFNLYAVSDGTNLPDQPVTGTNDDKYVISVNDFNSAGTRFLGVHYWVVNKSDVVSGAATIHFATNTPDSSMFSLHPAQHLSSSTTFYMVTDCTGTCITSSTSRTSTETVISITGLPPAAITVSSSSFSIATSVIGPDAAQPGTTTLLRTNDNRVESVAWESNSLWASWNDACVPSGDTATRTCLRLVQATTSGATATKSQDFDFSASGQYYFYPAVSSFQGQLVVSFGRSSSSIFPSAMATGRASADPVNTLQTPAVIKAGTTADTSTRYGDYFGAATDPTPTASSTFWVAGEYRADSTFQNWNTVIGQIASFGGAATFDFSVSLNPTSGSVVQGSGTTSTVTVSLVSGTSQTVSLSISTPSVTGLTATVNPTSGTPTYTSTLSISTTTSTPAGSYTITVTGTSGALTHSATYSLTVTAPGTGGDFGISASPSSLTLVRTSSTSTTITITSLNGFSGTVSLSTGALPAGVSASFNPASVAGSGTSTLTFTGSGGLTATGTFTVTVTGTSGSLTHSTTITLTITKH
jgi:hypothetical protein